MEFKTKFCIECCSDNTNNVSNIKIQYVKNGQGILTFGPLLVVNDIKKISKRQRWVTIKVYSCDDKVLNLKYRIPEHWPSIIPKFGLEVPTFRLIIASCLRMPGDVDAPEKFPSKLYKKFRDKILEKSHVQNDAVFILGDTVYLNEHNYNTKSGIISRYRQLQKRPELKGAWSSGATWNAIVDDHDVSINDGTYGTPSIDLCKKIFSKMWPNNPFQYKEVSPLTFAFTRYDVGFIGLDDRTYRTNPGHSYSTILGNKQIDWLRQVLFSWKTLRGKNTLIFILVGTPFIPPSSSSFNHYPDERQKVLDIINVELELKNVFILSGDSHFSDISVLGNIIEIRSSALSSPPSNPEKLHNPYRIPGSAVMENNFGTIDISGQFLNRTITYQTFTSNKSAVYTNSFVQKNI
jgi:alkaline phosphatase D